jgi:hypothetical protein
MMLKWMEDMEKNYDKTAGNLRPTPNAKWIYHDLSI